MNKRAARHTNSLLLLPSTACSFRFSSHEHVYSPPNLITETWLINYNAFLFDNGRIFTGRTLLLGWEAKVLFGNPGEGVKWGSGYPVSASSAAITRIRPRLRRIPPRSTRPLPVRSRPNFWESKSTNCSSCSGSFPDLKRIEWA